MDDATSIWWSTYGGSLSGEHGDGQSRAEFLPKMFGEDIVDAFREFKSIWDPDWKMNPGKVVDAICESNRISGWGRVTIRRNRKRTSTFPTTGISSREATLRCVGVGKCRQRRRRNNVPELHGDARGDALDARPRRTCCSRCCRGIRWTDGWRSEHVKDALDLCLSCKGCKGDCPVNVDMATYKAEFLSHYYEGRLRPRHMYASGLIHWWARPGVDDAGDWLISSRKHRALARLRNWLQGMRKQRKIPRFAPQTFKHWFRQRGPRNRRRKRIFCGPTPSTITSRRRWHRRRWRCWSMRGFTWWCRSRNLCCGRPLYDYGMLGTAKRWLLDIIARRCGRRFEPARRSSVWSRVASRFFATRCQTCFTAMKTRQRCANQRYMLAEFLDG